MKKLLLAILALSSLAMAQAPGPNVNSGRFMAANYGQWQVQVQSSSASKVCVSPVTVVLADGSKLNPWNTNASILIGSGANVETVTPSSFDFVSTPGQVCINGTYTKSHFFGDTVSSGTFGLQEAANAAGVKGGGAVTIDQNWTALGGTTAIKNAASLPSNVLIEDARSGVSAGGGGGAGSVFIIGNTACGTTPNCLQLVDDDTTDNCGAALTSFMASVNAYSGPGRVQLYIQGSSSGKAYKLATTNCNIALTNATNGAILHLDATIDCAQTAANCIQLGATGQSTGQAGWNYYVVGSGVLYNGANLTGAGIYVEPGVIIFEIAGIKFLGPSGSTHNQGFGANNATLGNCTNWAIFVDAPVAGGSIHDTHASVSSANGATSGGCGYGNPAGGVSGSNTVFFHNNVVGTVGNVGGPTGCGSQGIVDGGSDGVMDDNNIYGFGVSIRVLGVGQRITLNQIDATNCIASGVNAAIVWGATGTAAVTGPVAIIGNMCQCITGHTTNLVARAGDSTGAIQDSVIAENLNGGAGPSLGAARALASGVNQTCTVNATTARPCVMYGNQGYFLAATVAGWVDAPNQFSPFTSASQTGNLGSTTVFTLPATFFVQVQVGCSLTETVVGTTSTLPSCTIGWTDNTTNAVQTQTITSTSTNNTLGSYPAGFTLITPKAGTTITVSTTGYASTGPAMTYIVQVFIQGLT